VPDNVNGLRPQQVDPALSTTNVTVPPSKRARWNVLPEISGPVVSVIVPRSPDVHRKAGTAGWSEATVHEIKNVGATSSHTIRIELKC
jgi:hypothetical protein